jgi:isohexenylglutaconyl-CoA hydratase
MSTAFETLVLTIEPPFAQLVLNRPQAKNAMNFQMVEDLIEAFTSLQNEQTVRAVVISGRGGTFCAGGDFEDMQAITQMSEVEQIVKTSRVDTMLRAINLAPQVVIARVEGAALGAGFGLVCVSDIALAANDARLGMPEVRLGLVPAVIAPYVIQRVGLMRARQLMLTGQRFDGTAAHEYGIVHEVYPASGIEVRISGLLDELRHCAPNALRECKKLLFDVKDKALDQTIENRASLLNRLRAGEEAQEGIRAFNEKRPAKWVESER